MEADAVGRYRFLLLFRFLLINGTGLVLLGAVWMQGWVDRILAADDTHICKLIFALFVVRVVWTGQQVLMLSRRLNALERWPIGADARSTEVLRAMAGRDGHTRSALVGALRLGLAQRIGRVRHMASTLVLLGLIGTIVGFVIALSGVNWPRSPTRRRLARWSPPCCTAWPWRCSRRWWARCSTSG